MPQTYLQMPIGVFLVHLLFLYRFTFESNIYTHKKRTIKKQPDFLDFSNFAVKSKT